MKSLTLDNGPILSQTENSFVLPNSVTNIRFIPVASHNSSTIRVAGQAVLSGTASQTINLLVRTVTITITVTAQNPNFVTTYRIRVTRVACK